MGVVTIYGYFFGVGSLHIHIEIVYCYDINGIWTTRLFENSTTTKVILVLIDVYAANC